MEEIDAAPARRGRDIIVAVFRHPFVLMVIGVVFVVAALAVSSKLSLGLRSVFGRGDLVRLTAAIITCASGISAYWLFVRAIERRAFSDFQLKGAAGELGFGVLTGFVLMALSIGIIALLGGYEVTAFRTPAILLPVLAMTLISSITEEIVMRGIMFRFIEMALGSWIALALSAILFGAMHMGNPNSSWLAAGAIALEAGVMLAAIYMVTRRLWAAIGIHAGWNFSQAGIFGVPVSGIKLPGLLVSNIQGDALISGGTFGAEASLPALIICTVTGLLFLTFAIKRGQVVRASWKRLAAPCPTDADLQIEKSAALAENRAKD